MGNEVMRTAIAIVTSIVGLAILSVLVSRNATTVPLIGALSQGLSQTIGAATAPVTGGGGIGGFGSNIGAYNPPSYYG